MKAIVLTEPGGTDRLRIEEIAKPALNTDEVLVQVKAISINPVDVKSRSGKGVYGRIKEQQPLILGWDISGIVTESQSSKFKEGDEVFGMVNFPGHGKAYAEFVAAPASHLAIKPANIPHEQAAAATLAALTAYQALTHKANVQAGQKVLIHAAAGGVGHFAVQLAKLIGAHVTGTSSAKNKSFVVGLGADDHIDYHGYDWKNSDKEFDFILDAVGGNNIDNSLEVAKPGGILISIPSGLSEDVTSKAKAKGVNGFFFMVESNGDDMKAIAGLLETGKIKAHVPQTFSFEEIGKAHDLVESGRTVGKVVVTL
ncbi:NADP-dependent oxidoreductase [Terrimonas sp. NA20]|uniref:NADP-dependent oxidoreductase n=1 Tax=Terrimonas ginsenosidimutans TaxID=2908004 RepID=A0ABS9KSK5_9BACT|nr:NADP-dependent oxidoreductase [Terrimonas ginsenosidimutans]MCG2615316.1 NADP-dependent oxidoreductase [Terrimonas ginsenosidimutans]